MIGYFDLHDMYAVFTGIRFCPNHPANLDIVNGLLSVLREKGDHYDFNQIRRIIQSCDACHDKDGVYGFAATENKYTYIPLLVLKDEKVYDVLIASCEELKVALNDGNPNRICDLADCLHNLPIEIAESNYTIPKTFWKNEIKCYRSKWNDDFLAEEQKTCRAMR